MFATINNKCLHLSNQNDSKMPRIKTVENKRKAGRPKLAPSTTVSFRIPIHLKNQVENRYGKHWPQIFKDFIAVLLAEDKG
jgi:hypothetical protein